MADLSNYAETASFNHILRATPLTSPATIYMRLFNTDPTDAATGTEVTGGGYAAEAITMGADTNGVGTNSVKITFTTATSDWDTINYLAVYDHPTAGNLLAHSSVGTPKTITTGNNCSFAIGVFSISVTVAAWSNYLRSKMYNHLFKATTYTSPTTIYAAAYLTDPTIADTGTEASGGTYARQTIAYDAPTNGVGDNNAQVTFPIGTANHGTMAYGALRDALTTGNLLMFGALTDSIAYNIGDTPRMPVNTNIITIA